MTPIDDQAGLAPLEVLSAEALLRERVSADADARLAEWLVQHARATMTPAQTRQNERTARQFAVRTRSRLIARHASESLPVHPLRSRNATVHGCIADAMPHAFRQHCAPWVEESRVAAGTGRALWDEECARWVELPAGVRSARVVALTVSGDSMMPVLRPGDVIVVELQRRVEIGDIVVARVPDGGYVVKRLSSTTRDAMELESFNVAYAPYYIPRDSRLIAGVVSAVLREQP